MSDSCLFCKIIKGEIKSEIVFESDDCIAFKDINPVSPTHLLFIPKKHIESLDKIETEDSSLIGNILLEISKFARDKGFSEKGYRVVNNMGRNGGQTVFHIHFHLLAERRFTWPPG